MAAVLLKQAQTELRIVAPVLMKARTIDIDSSGSNRGQVMFNGNDSNGESIKH